MTVFNPAELGGLDWTLLQNGAITCYRDRDLFEQDLKWLADHGYVIARVDCTNPDVFHATMSQALKFRENFGYEWTDNLDALNDAARYIDFEQSTGVVLGMTAFEKLYAIEPDLAVSVLDILECSSRDHLLLGNRLIGLVQTNNAMLALPNLGGRAPSWNDNEFLDRLRESTKHLRDERCPGKPA